MKINARKYFNINKTTDVTATVDLVDRATEIQIAMLENEDTEREITALDQAKEGRKLTQDMLDFIQETMKYSDKQMLGIRKNLEVEKVGVGVGYLIMRLNGASDEDIDLAEKEDRRKAQEAKSSK